MSRQSKQAKKAILAYAVTQLHLKGQRGPARTKKVHTKVNTWYAARKAEVELRARVAAQEAREREARAKKAVEKQQADARKAASAAKRRPPTNSNATVVRSNSSK